MLIFDAHLDLAFNAVEWNRDLRLDLQDLRVQERVAGMTSPGRGTATITFPEMRRGNVGLVVATLFGRIEMAMNHPIGYTTPMSCYAAAHAQLAYYRAMESMGWMKQLRNKTDLANHAKLWQKQPDTAPFGYVLSMECADAVLDPMNIHEWYSHGLRAIGITHYNANRYGGGTGSEIGLALEAIPLLKEIEKLGIALDMTHLSDRSFDQVRDHFGGRVIASHQNARKFCHWQRQFSDEQIKFVLSRDGVLGMALDAIMLQPGWVRGQSVPEVTMERVVDNIDHICQMAGNCRNVGIGSDLDGGYGYEQTPKDLNTIADLQKLVPLLSQRGYPAADIEAILHGNWLRFFGEVLPAS